MEILVTQLGNQSRPLYTYFTYIFLHLQSVSYSFLLYHSVCCTCCITLNKDGTGLTMTNPLRARLDCCSLNYESLRLRISLEKKSSIARARARVGGRAEREVRGEKEEQG